MGRRSIWKGPFTDPCLYKKIKKALETGSRSAIKTWSRRSTILPAFINLTFAVHNGIKFIPVLVKESMVGKKLGEFSHTRTFKGHAGNRKAIKGK